MDKKRETYDADGCLRIRKTASQLAAERKFFTSVAKIAGKLLLEKGRYV